MARPGGPAVHMVLTFLLTEKDYLKLVWMYAVLRSVGDMFLMTTMMCYRFSFFVTI